MIEQSAHSRSYPVRVVGSRNFPISAGGCRAGDLAIIFHETGNPFDPQALGVAVHNRLVGYIPRDNFVRGGIFDRGEEMRAHVLSADPGREGVPTIVLAVTPMCASADHFLAELSYPALPFRDEPGRGLPAKPPHGPGWPVAAWVACGVVCLIVLAVVVLAS